MNAILDPILSLMALMYQYIGSLGLVVVVFTLVLRLILHPLNRTSYAAMRKIRLLQPELDKLKAAHKGDSAGFQQAQLALYKRENVNPMAGCLPQIIQIAVVIVLYQALIRFLNQPVINGVTVDPSFLWFNMGQRDPLFILPILAGVSQLGLSLLMSPMTAKPAAAAATKKGKKHKKAAVKVEEKSPGFADSMMMAQKQMLFMMPVMTGVIAASLPAGIGLYWTLSTVFSLGEQLSILTKSERTAAFNQVLQRLPFARKKKE